MPKLCSNIQLSVIVVVVYLSFFAFGCSKDSEGEYAASHASEEAQLAANFTSISNSLKKPTGANIDRNQAVMLFIADPFFDIQGQSARLELEITLLSHLQNYKFTEFSFSIIESKTIEPDVIDADTLLEVRIENLTSDKTSVIDGHTYRSRSIIRWKQIDRSWKIYSGLLFRSSELFLKE